MSRLLLLTAAVSAMMACTAATPASQSAAAPATVAASSSPSGAMPAPPAAAPTATRAQYDSAAWCDVRVTPTRNGAAFEALASADAWSAVEYELVITKRDAGGSSDIVQSGDAELRAGETQTLGEAELSLERGARFRATLVVSEAGYEICSAEARS